VNSCSACFIDIKKKSAKSDKTIMQNISVFYATKTNKNTGIATNFMKKSFEMKKNDYLCSRKIAGFELKKDILI
jgi:hypothetical protein